MLLSTGSPMDESIRLGKEKNNKSIPSIHARKTNMTVTRGLLVVSRFNELSYLMLNLHQSQN